MTRYRKVDKVTARRPIEDFDVPRVPEGAEGTVVATTLFGRPKQVAFAVSDGWGLKRFQARVRPSDIRRARAADQ